MRNKVLAALFVGLLVFAGGCGTGTPKILPTSSGSPQASASSTPSPKASASPSESARPNASPGGSATGSGTPCADPDKWTTGSEDDPAMATAGLYDLRAAKHDGCDRLVFDIDGPEPAGYHAAYVDVAKTPGKGDPVKVKGSAVIQIGIRAWDCAHFGNKTDCPSWKIGHVLVDKPLGNVQEVKFAGVQEGQCEFAIGVDAKRPFHVTTWTSGNVMHVIIDIFH